MPQVEREDGARRPEERRPDRDHRPGGGGEFGVLLQRGPHHQPAHRVRDEQQPRGPAGRAPVRHQVLPPGQVCTGVTGQRRAVVVDGQPPVVGERLHRLRCRGDLPQGLDEVGVGLESFEDGQPPRPGHQRGGADPGERRPPEGVGVGGLLQLVRVQAPQKAVAGGRVGEHRPVHPPQRAARLGVVQDAAHDAGHHDAGVERPVVEHLRHARVRHHVNGPVIPHRLHAT